MLKVALDINLKLARAGFWNLVITSGLGKLSGSEKAQEQENQILKARH